LHRELFAKEEMADKNLPGLIFKENIDAFIVTLFGSGSEFMNDIGDIVQEFRCILYFSLKPEAAS